MRIEERALLVKLTINQWSAKKTDKEVSLEVVTDKGARLDSGSFRKQLVSKDALKKISKVTSAARSTHYTLTLPWNDDGSRIITTTGYQHYAKVMYDYRVAMQEAVDEFLEGYSAFVKAAKQDLGKLFKREDYPDVEDIRRKFNFDVEPTSIAVARDFRAKVSNEEAAIIAKDIEARTNARLEQAMKDVYERIAKVTEKMAEKLSEYDPGDGATEATGIFHSTLVENVRDLADILPSLNVTGDAELTKIQKDMVKNLCRYDAEDLRMDEEARRLTARNAKLIHKKVSAFIA